MFDLVQQRDIHVFDGFRKLALMVDDRCHADGNESLNNCRLGNIHAYVTLDATRIGLSH